MNSIPFIKIGGVPEHFNLPWIQAFEQNKSQSLGAEISWNFFPGGTGAMTQALSNGSLDVAILLTEGYMAAFQKGLNAKIIQCYIESPLQWGIYSNKKDQVRFDQATKIAISRKGSGSHLMPLIHAEQHGVMLQENQFVVVHHLDDGIKSLSEDCDYFYWEKWMTQPFVDQGIVKKVGEFSAPWSGFLVVATQSCIDQNSQILLKIIEMIQEQVKIFIADDQSPFIIEKKFNLNIDEAKDWIGQQKWNLNHDISRLGLQNAHAALTQIGIDMSQVRLEDLFAPWLNLK